MKRMDFRPSKESQTPRHCHTVTYHTIAITGITLAQGITEPHLHLAHVTHRLQRTPRFYLLGVTIQEATSTSEEAYENN